MIDPQSLSSAVSQHDVRSAFGRVKQDQSLMNDFFTGQADDTGIAEQARCELKCLNLVSGFENI